MSSEWPIEKLGDLTINLDTKRKPVKEADRKPGPYPYYGASGIVDYVDGYIFDGEHLLIAEDGENLRTRHTPIAFRACGQFWVNNHAHIVVGNERASTRYLEYAVLASDITSYLTGAVMPKLTQGNMNRIEVPCPPRDVQDQIVGVLGSLDDRITLLRETNTTLEAIAQALFKSWFVDFDPVHAKMQGRAPEGMDEATAALFPDSFEESELGAVPKGWKLVPFGQLLSHTIGGDWGSDVADEKNDTRVAIIRGTDIPDLQTNASSRVPVRYTSQKKLAVRKLEDGDLLLEVSGGSKDQPTGRSLFISAALLSQFDCPVEPASFCRLLRPMNKEVGVLLAQHLTFIYAQGKTWEYQNQSTGIANFQTTHFLETELVACPPDDVLSAFVETVRPLLARSHLTQIQVLVSLRDTLLPRLISGQLRISEAQNEMENV
ncbi:MAG: restriction endonuclease subunit S [Limnohabitans sp.]|uniref:restriction endonuclease subunit S n=1 Tax=Limnohabitans sp. TaxID=1907725 RepID=UPI0025E95B46|nr:restriction endonuclease subunit S [Limnohabitans sp.]MCO4088883.1 restriction endonuclease subunit S [Limnohabitans sp.]